MKEGLFITLIAMMVITGYSLYSAIRHHSLLLSILTILCFLLDGVIAVAWWFAIHLWT